VSKPSICCVVPSIRPEQMAEFRKAWAPLFERHGVTLITVWDGDEPWFEVSNVTSVVDGLWADVKYVDCHFYKEWNSDGLLCRRTDAVRNMGFIRAARYKTEYILTLDDDVHPPAGSDPIQEHLDVLQRRFPIRWMNTALDTGDCMSPSQADQIINGGETDSVNRRVPYLRGFPYGIRDEAQVKVSHGVWVNVPDFDGKTQLELGECRSCEGTGAAGGKKDPQYALPSCNCIKCGGTGYDSSRLPYSLPYFRGPVPKGTYFPFCGMNVMVHRNALPYLYFAPMGPDSGIEGLNRFADIWCGILLKRAMDAMSWAVYTGASTVIHTRASDPFKNVEQERLGVEWNEWAWRQYGPEYANCYPKLEGADTQSHVKFREYWRSYLDKAARFRDLIRKLQGAS